MSDVFEQVNDTEFNLEAIASPETSDHAAPESFEDDEYAAAEKWRSEEEQKAQDKADLMRRFREAKGQAAAEMASANNNDSQSSKGAGKKGNVDKFWSSDEHQKFHHGDADTSTKSTKSTTDEEPTERCFVTKVPRDASEADLVDYFSQYGNVTDCHMPRIPHRSGHKGIAFVSFDDCDVAATVREMGGHFLFDQELVVDRATTRDPTSGSKKRVVRLAKEGGDDKGGNWGNNNNSNKGGNWGSGNNDSWGNSTPSNNAWGSGKGDNNNDNWGGNNNSNDNWGGNNSNDSWGGNNNENWGSGNGSNNKGTGKGYGKPSRPPPPPLGSKRTPGFVPPPLEKDNRVFVTKIGYAVTKDNLVEYFGQFGPLSDIYVPMNANDPDRPHKGIAFLSFGDPDIAAEVLSRPQYEIKPGQFVVCDTATNRSNMNGGGGNGKGGGKGNGRGGKPY